MQVSSARQPSTVLFFPPYCQTALDGPHLGVHQLVAYLRREGVPCESYDLNVRFFRWLAEPNGKLDELASRRFEEFVRFQKPRGASRESADAFQAIISSLACAPKGLLQERLAEHLVTDPSRAVRRPRGGPVADGWWDGPTGSLLHCFDELHPVNNSTVESACQAVSTEGQSLFSEFYSRSEVGSLLDQAAKADVVGISVSFAIQLEAALTLAKAIRRRRKETFIVLGGTQICLLHDTDIASLARLPFVDGIVLYEGEVPLTALCRSIASCTSLADVPNLVYVGPDGSLVRTPCAEPIHPRDLPTPEFDVDELALYRSLTLPVYVTRGCYWGKCTFCDYVKLYTPGQPRVLARGPAQVVDDVKRLQSKHRVFRFRLITEAIPPKWGREFSSAILAEGVSASFWTYLKNEAKEVLTQDLFDLMKSAGIDDVTCGVESTSDRVLKVIVKGTTLECITDNFAMMKRAGIRAVFNVIPDYPTTSHEEALEGLEYIIRNKDVIPSVNFQMFDLSVKSSIAGCPEDYGLEVPSTTAFVESPHGAHSLRFKRKIGLSPVQHRRLRSAYQAIRGDIALYHVTVRNRERVAARDFDWRKATFAFREFSAVRSSYSLLPRLRRKETCFAFIPSLLAYVEVPRWMEGILVRIVEARQQPLSYSDVLRAYSRALGELELEPYTPEEEEESLREALVAFVETGLVEDVVGGPCFAPSEAVSNLLAARQSAGRRSTARKETERKPVRSPVGTVGTRRPGSPGT